MGPVVAAGGTVTTICVELEELIVAATPLKVTVFSEGVELKPVPLIVTEEPTGPWSGVNAITDTCDEV